MLLAAVETGEIGDDLPLRPCRALCLLDRPGVSGGAWDRKPVEAFARQADAHELARTLGPGSIVAIGIGAIVGAGIFVLTGTAAAQYAGPAIIISFLVAAIACGFVGLCYAELAAMLPVSGSTYAYTYAAVGELAAWVIGWDLILEYTLGAATVASGWSGYALSLLRGFGVAFPPALAAAPGTPVPDGVALFNLPAAAIVLLLTLLLVRGTRETSGLNNVMVCLKLAVVIAFVALGAFHVDRANWHPLIPANTGEFGHYGLSGILRGASVVFFAFLGFDTVSTTAQEAVRPQRDVPIGILGSLSVCTVLYIGVAAVLTGLVPFAQLDVADPIAKGVDAIGVPWFSGLIKLAAIAGLTTVVLVLLYGQGRILFAMAGDGLLPGVFARVHPRLQTPYLSQAAIGVAVAALAGLVPANVLGEMVSIGTLFAFTLVCVSVLYLRRAAPAQARPFRAPWVPLVPVLGIGFCLLLMAGLPLATWLRLLIWLLAGLLVYALYGSRHSVVRAGAGPR